MHFPLFELKHIHILIYRKKINSKDFKITFNRIGECSNPSKWQQSMESYRLIYKQHDCYS